MTAYEYLTESFHDPRPLQDYLNIMGGLRWELCAAYYEHQSLRLIFKRAIVPAGFEVDSFDKNTCELTLKPSKPKKVTERIKSVADIIADLGPDDEEVIIYKKLISAIDAPHVINNQIAVMLAKCLNEGWKPNWDNSNECKYYPWFDMRGSSGFRFDGCVDWLTLSLVGSRLCFKTWELAEYAGSQFTDVYKKFMLIN